MRLKDEQAQGLIVGIRGGQNHAFGDAKTHLARCEVSDHDGKAAFEFFGLIGATNAREDITRTPFADIEREAQELVGTFNGFTLDDLGNTKVNLREVVNRAFRGDRFATRQDGFGFRSLFRDESVLLFFHVNTLHEMCKGLNRVRGGQRRIHACPGQRFDREEVFYALSRRW